MEEQDPGLRCDACGIQRAPLLKLSLGKDFFGRPYDRLSPSADQSPKWYCEPCSMHKNLQRDFRDIQAEFMKWTAGTASETRTADHVQRARLRLREITLLLGQATGPSPFLTTSEVTGLMHALEALGESASAPSRTGEARRASG